MPFYYNKFWYTILIFSPIKSVDRLYLQILMICICKIHMCLRLPTYLHKRINNIFFLSLCLKKLKKKQHCKIKFSLFLSLQTIELDPIDFTIVIHSHINFWEKWVFKKAPWIPPWGCMANCTYKMIFWQFIGHLDIPRCCF